MNWYLEELSIERIQKIENTQINRRDTSNYEAYAEKLKEQLKHLDKNSYPETFKRLSAVLKVFQGSSLNKAGNNLGFSDNAVLKWRDLYLNENCDIEKIKVHENYKGKEKRDTSNDEQNATILEGELKKLDKKTHKFTIDRITAILLVIRDRKKLKEAGNSVKTSDSSVSHWIKIFDKKGIEGLLNMNSTPLTSRDADETQKLINDFEEALKDIDPNKNPLGKKRAEIILKKLKKEITVKKAVEQLGVYRGTINKWIRNAKENGAKKYLEETEALRENRVMIFDSKREEHLLKLENELKELDPINFNKTHERAAIILPILRGKKTEEEVANETALNIRTVTDWLDFFYIGGGLKKLKKLNGHDIYREKKRKPKGNPNSKKTKRAKISRKHQKNDSSTSTSLLAALAETPEARTKKRTKNDDNISRKKSKIKMVAV